MVTIRKLSSVIIVLLAHQAAVPQSINFDDFSEDTGQLLGDSNQELSTDDVFKFISSKKITIASGTQESIENAPASIVIVTADDIKKRGYSNIAEVMSDLPGFDTMVLNGLHYINAYQRGYRTPFTQRTMFMINGVVQNHLWSHAAGLSRQIPLSNIKRIEVLYGPASAVYGPNAFLGTINIVTYDGSEFYGNNNVSEINLMAGSYNTRSLDITTRGKSSFLHYSIAGKLFKSDEPDLSGKWGFLSNDLYSNRNHWGPILDQGNNTGKYFGKYSDPTEDYGVNGVIGVNNFKVMFNIWEVKEGYGPYYAADRAQNSAIWRVTSRIITARYDNRVSNKLTSDYTLSFRNNTMGGEWTEASPDSTAGQEQYSFISWTTWNTDSSSILFKNNYHYNLTKSLILSTGLKYEVKNLTMAYDIPGYYGAFSSTVPNSNTGTHGQGAAIGYSTDATYTRVEGPAAVMPAENMITSEDIGGFVQTIFDFYPFRFHGGVRYDKNSIYGDSINPRVSGIYKFMKKNAVKLVYGEAFQEPAPIQLYGGWDGRASNPNLRPEKVRNIESILLLGFGNLLTETSVFYARFTDVIKEESENAGNRTSYGTELKLLYKLPVMIPDSKQATLYSNATYTQTESSRNYNHTTSSWEDQKAFLGDIAPYKFNLGINIPFYQHVNINIRTNYVSKRELYSRNPLSAQGVTLDEYWYFSGNIAITYEHLTLRIKGNNLTNEQFLHPGPENAVAGNDFSTRSSGFINSAIPQPNRNFEISLAVRI